MEWIQDHVTVYQQIRIISQTLVAILVPILTPLDVA